MASRYVRPIPKRLLPDEMLVYPLRGNVQRVGHVKLEWEQSACTDEHRAADGGSGIVFIDAVNSEGAFEIEAGSRVLVGAGPSLLVKKCKRCCVVRGQVHHWELVVA